MFRRIFCLALVAFAAPAFAYYSVMDNGEIMGPNKYKLTGETQFFTDAGGVDFSGRFDVGFNEDVGFRGLLGFGKTDFFAGGLVKWMPIPDVEGQPAIGANMGIVYAKDGGFTDLNFRFEPLISKKFRVNFGDLTPYASIPLAIQLRNSDGPQRDDTELTSQLVVGSQVKLKDWRNLQFIGEFGAELDNAESYISFGAVIYFDEEGFDLPGYE